MRMSPLQKVKKNFESRAKLVDQLVGSVDRQHGDTSDDQVRSRLMSLSNQKLLRLYAAEQKVRERFGDKAQLVEHILGARKKAGLTADAIFRAKLEASSKARLLDIAREKHPDAPAKQTPEQRLAKKRGRKERERALSKIKQS